MSLQYGELQPTNGGDRLASLGHPIIFQRVSRLGSVRHCSSGSQPNFAALNRGRQLYLAGRPSRLALAHSSANLEWSEMCCTRLARNAGPKKSPKFAIWASSNNFVGPYLRN